MNNSKQQIARYSPTSSFILNAENDQLNNNSSLVKVNTNAQIQINYIKYSSHSAINYQKLNQYLLSGQLTIEKRIFSGQAIKMQPFYDLHSGNIDHESRDAKHFSRSKSKRNTRLI